MPFIESDEDLDWYKEHFGEVWNSAILRFSTIEIEDV